MSILQQLGTDPIYAVSSFVLILSLFGLSVLLLWETDMTGLQPVRVAFTDSNGDDIEVHSVPLDDDPDVYATAMLQVYPKFRDYYIIIE